MLQQVEYDPKKFKTWLHSLNEKNRKITSVMHRQDLTWTKRAQLLVVSCYLVVAIVLSLAVMLMDSVVLNVSLGIFILPFTLIIWLYCLTWFAHRLIVQPEQKRLTSQAKNIFQEHKAAKIAVLGSYGKTSMKELLHAVLSEKLKVATTPGNKNVSLSHARFAKKLSGDEDVIIVEFGEGEPGDIARMADMLRPDIAIVTGLAPNHLDQYKTLDAVAKDFKTTLQYVASDGVYYNRDSESLEAYFSGDANPYDITGVDGISVESYAVAIDALEIIFSIGSQKSFKVDSHLIGAHQVGPLSVALKLALDMGLSRDEIRNGIQKMRPYDHRMQPRLMNGAWLIDDTYNGSIEGMRAGLNYLKAVTAKRKWYVTPGLVDQGEENVPVHKELGSLIADANPDVVVLMENSVKDTIQKSILSNGYAGEIRIVDDPLSFYTNIEHEVANGDVILMQNDWTDNYM